MAGALCADHRPPPWARWHEKGAGETRPPFVLKKPEMKKQDRSTSRFAIDLDRVLGGVVLMALHEIDSLHGLGVAAGERLRVARAARSVPQLLREQRRLLLRTRRRMAENRMIRRQLWTGLLQDLRSDRAA
ncbi:hypothetical protein [Solimonas terrae]|uniref:Uncharacterized protein n=1 Tax=Solimonas terrae TaxID=1396819 RepID=A0A6M2BT37_9GAMM|nr:hypothetical protein [Solimonas terrae]NGY05189.1 hypothetical protein [Solimonas terrae]